MANILKLHINEVKNKSGNSTIKLTIIKNIIKTEFFITLSFIFYSSVQSQKALTQALMPE